MVGFFSLWRENANAKPALALIDPTGLVSVFDVISFNVKKGPVHGRSDSQSTRDD